METYDMNREFLMLAKTFDPDKHDISGWFCSIKYDGQRCFWDGGVTRDKLKITVPWANNAKDERYVNEQICTGLWTRYGNVIHAPDFFLDELPEGICLDGELWFERNKFQSLRSIVSSLTPNESLWRNIFYLVFESPSPTTFCLSGRINNPQFKKFIHYEDCNKLFEGFDKYVPMFKELKPFPSNSSVIAQIEQIRLPNKKNEALTKLYDLLEEETDKDGEGLMLRNPNSCYQVRRSPSLLKVKPFEIDTGIVVGWQPGVGKYSGMMGSLTIEWCNKTFNLSGFTDDERKLADKPFKPLYFNLGDKIKFKYTSLTRDGIPREARYASRASSIKVNS